MSEQNLYQAIRLSRLKKSPDNVRKTPPTQAEQDELKTSIAARGLLQPLVVKPAARKGYFEVTAGGRRLDMLKALHKEGALPKTYAAPCNVRDGSGGEDSLAENLHRAAMHPAELMNPRGNINPRYESDTRGIDWLLRIQSHFDRTVWLNPDPTYAWTSRTCEVIQRLFPMFHMSVDGIEEAVGALVGARSAPTHH